MYNGHHRNASLGPQRPGPFGPHALNTHCVIEQTFLRLFCQLFPGEGRACLKTVVVINFHRNTLHTPKFCCPPTPPRMSKQEEGTRPTFEKENSNGGLISHPVSNHLLFQSFCQKMLEMSPKHVSKHCDCGHVSSSVLSTKPKSTNTNRKWLFPSRPSKFGTYWKDVFRNFSSV